MFGLGPRKQAAETTNANFTGTGGAAVRLYELTFFPDGEVINQGWVEASPGGFEKPPEGKVEGEFAFGGSPCKIDATVRGGNAILSMWADGKIVTNALLLSSPDEAGNAELTAMYLKSARNTDLVKALTAGREVFGEVEQCRERPLLATMLTPAPSRELTDTLIDVQRSWVAAVLG